MITALRCLEICDARMNYVKTAGLFHEEFKRKSKTLCKTHKQHLTMSFCVDVTCKGHHLNFDLWPRFKFGAVECVPCTLYHHCHMV